ncbi:hypothetical protein [Streptomyces sp. GbtcB6]|uniref:hypothetical protein n=1 Tax=Streptomyces sp. GbtcB6 TaxID=2824751 RepID=UPI001C300F33|nr:hypothetical protein [Streptomyces sp. GbtcB6]
MTGAFEVAAGWLEEGTPEARALGEEIFALLDLFDEEEVAEVAAALESGDWEAGSW